MLELPVRMVGTRAVATVGINGTPVPLTVDTGAFFSMLTDAAAAQLDLPRTRADRLRVQGITGSVDAKMTTVGKLKVLNGEASNVQFIVGGNEPGGGTMGLMGRNILTIADTEYDLAHGVIRFLFPNDECGKLGMAYWADGAPVTEIDLLPDTGSRLPSIRALVRLNGIEVKALFDTGATTVVSIGAARRAGIAEADLKRAGIFLGAGRGRSKAWTTRFDRFELGGEAVSPTRLPVGDFDLRDADMLIGIDFFLSHRIYVSKAQSKMYSTYNGGPVFALDQRVTAADGGSNGGSGDGSGDAAASGEAGAPTADKLARRGSGSAARRDYASALADLDRACAMEPTSAAFFAQRGVIEEALKRTDKALEDFDRALTLDAAQVDARARRAALRSQAKDHDGARADLDALDRTIAPQAQLRLAMARLYLTLDEPARALAQLDQWLPSHLHEVTRDSALNSRCWIRLRLGIELDRALDDCDDAVDAEPKNPVYLSDRSWIDLRLGKYGKALADFDRSIALRPKYAWSPYGRGVTKTRVGRFVEGDADLAAARDVLPDIEARVTRAGVMAAAVASP